MNIGYFGYAVFIFYLMGGLILMADVKAYKNANFKKEQKVSLILGWLTISLGAALMVGNWIYKYFIL